MHVVHTYITTMSNTTINRLELTEAQRIEFQALLERNCSKVFDQLGDAVWETSQEYASALNASGDDDITEDFREQLIEIVDYRCAVPSLTDWYISPPLSLWI